MRTANNPIKSLQTSINILSEIYRSGGATMTELSDSLSITKGTVHNHLTTLEENGYVVRDGGTFNLGIKFFQFGEQVKARQPVYDSSKAEVDKLARQTGELTNLMIEQHGRGYYLYRAVGEDGIRLPEATSAEFLHNTSSGKAILAHLPEDRVREILDYHGLPRTTRHTITETETLLEKLESVRERGVAFDEEERASGIRCVAVPIVVEGVPQGAISLSGPTSRFEGDYYRTKLPKLLRDTVNVIEINMTYSD